MKESKDKINRALKTRMKEVRVKRLDDGKYHVYFDFVKVPIKMSLSYLAMLINKKHIAIRDVLHT